MKTKDTIRWIFTLVLLYFIWQGKIWAIALSLTLTIVSAEVALFRLKKLKEEHK